MALHNCTGKGNALETQLGLGQWRAHKEVLSRTVHTKHMAMSMHNVRVCWHGVALSMQHAKSIKMGLKIANLKGKISI